MEILIGLLAQAGYFLAQLVLEVLLQIVFEVFGSLAIHGAVEPFADRKRINPFLAAVGYALFGALAGALSLWLLPTLLIEGQWQRVANLVATPIAAGLAMAALGVWRRRKDKVVLRIDSFAYGYCFALAMAIVRFVWGS